MNYDEFRWQMNSLIGGVRRPLYIQERGDGSPQNTADFHDAEEQMFELIFENQVLWQKYQEDNKENDFIRNIELPS